MVGRRSEVVRRTRRKVRIVRCRNKNKTPATQCGEKLFFWRGGGVCCVFFGCFVFFVLEDLKGMILATFFFSIIVGGCFFGEELLGGRCFGDTLLHEFDVLCISCPPGKNVAEFV